MLAVFGHALLQDITDGSVLQARAFLPPRQPNFGHACRLWFLSVLECCAPPLFCLELRGFESHPPHLFEVFWEA